MSRFFRSLFTGRSTSDEGRSERGSSRDEPAAVAESKTGHDQVPLSGVNDSENTRGADGSSSRNTGESEWKDDVENSAAPSATDTTLAEDDDDANLVTWDSPSDPANPQNWPSWWRWTMITLASFISFIAGLSSSMFAPAIPAVLHEFNSTNETLGSFVITIFLLGMTTGPVIFAPLSELYGRLVIQHVGNVGFLLFTMAIALATDLNMVIVFRLFQGAFSSVCLTNGGGIIADTIPQSQRGFALGMFTVGVLAGPVVGPVPGSFLAAAEGWRWVFWLLTILMGITTVLCFIFWRETYAPVILGRKAERLRKETGNMLLRTKYDVGQSKSTQFSRAIGRVLKILAYSPIVLALAIYVGLASSYFYLLFTTLTPIYESVYGFSPSVSGLSYIGVGIGFILGQAIFSFGSDRILQRLAARKNGGDMKPEYRLAPSVLGGILSPIGLFWYGWTTSANIHWIVPMIGSSFIGLGNSLTFMSVQAYTVDAFTLYASSALAACTIIRSAMGTVLPIAAPQLYDRLGYGWGNSLLAFIALAMMPIPGLLMLYGERLRLRNAERIKKL